MNTGTWSAAYDDPECTVPVGRKCFVWIRPEADAPRSAQLFEWLDPDVALLSQTNEPLARPRLRDRLRDTLTGLSAGSVKLPRR